MNHSARSPLVTVLMLVAVYPAHAAAQALLVQVDNDARIPAADLAEMEQVVARSFLGIGVQVIWEHSKVALEAIAAASAGGHTTRRPHARRGAASTYRRFPGNAEPAADSRDILLVCRLL